MAPRPRNKGAALLPPQAGVSGSLTPCPGRQDPQPYVALYLGGHVGSGYLRSAPGSLA